VLELSLTAGKRGAVSRAKTLANFSMHGLARWFQRCGHGGDAALMRDMNLVAGADLSILADGGGGVKIATDQHGGGWRGRLSQVVGADGSCHRLICARTWLPE
jgi:hypothetical protein